MGKICVNGIIREATPEEEAELERMAAEMPTPEPTPEERLAALEEVFSTLLTGKKDQ